MSQLDSDFWDRSEEETSAEEDYQYFTEEESPKKSQLYDLNDSETIEEFLDVEEVSVVDNARIRLEQGRLYEMLIKHNLFDGVDAMPQAVAKVQSEIKEFIIERLEILLGMKSEKQKEVHQIIAEPQFNDLEVQALKMIASKVTKGASETASEATPVVPDKPKNELNAIKSAGPSKPVLNSVKKPAPVAVQKKTHNQAPPVKKSINREILKKNTEEDIKDLSPELIAKKDMKYIESLKQMSLSEANQIVSERHNRPRYPGKLDQESINRQYSAKMALNKTAQDFAVLLAAAKKK